MNILLICIAWILVGLYGMGQLETYIYVQRKAKGYDDEFYKFTRKRKCLSILSGPITILCLIFFPLIDLIVLD